jgi:hypothetical protein
MLVLATEKICNANEQKEQEQSRSCDYLDTVIALFLQLQEMEIGNSREAEQQCSRQEHLQ